MMTSFIEDTTESQLVRHWLGIEMPIAKEISRVKGSTTLNDFLTSHINNSTAITQ
jgi:hypothetical protein